MISQSPEWNIQIAGFILPRVYNHKHTQIVIIYDREKHRICWFEKQKPENVRHFNSVQFSSVLFI